MSYDLMVFDPEAAPREREQFVIWYRQQTEWTDAYSDVDPAISAEGLQSWYRSMLPAWPNMQEINDDQVDDPHVTGYTISRSSIYADFRWSAAEEAYEAVRRLAIEHRVGFYDVSGDDGDGEIYFPGDTPRPPSGGAWRDVSQQFKDTETTIAPPKASWFDFFRRKK
ncbi:hypothetical protein [Sphingomonas sp.]|uniref:hypothetical protein n=1 Tax=Sphingomonas sp. TaxID=28214 RepID=UPI00286B9AD1|nr:hypothetical protein [Sphingomonas sp.]